MSELISSQPGLQCRLGPDAPHGHWRSAPSSPLLAGQPPAQRRAPAVSGSQTGTHIVLCVPIGARGAAHRGSRRIAPAVARRARELPARRPLPSASACGRPRRGPVAAVLPHWSHGDGRLPDGRLTRPLPPPAEGHGREAWCQQRSGTAGGRWQPRLPSHPASSLDPHALVRTAFDHSEADRRGLWGTRRGRTPSGEYL